MEFKAFLSARFEYIFIRINRNIMEFKDEHETWRECVKETN